MSYSIQPLTTKDREAVISLYNYYVENSFAAYPEKKVPNLAFDSYMLGAQALFAAVAKDEKGLVAGFGTARIFNPIPVFHRTVELVYYVSPEHMRKGVGTMLLEYLVGEAGKKKIATFIAGMTSMNEIAIHFHEKNGFTQCGKFEKLGEKKGEVFDVVWMQKIVQ
ncbi:N-acetyltransferase family protein [Desulfococcaceae bacterium OttesenSCG-928-F15]|nr:N-acetyltransferase family protein [Desulfococcaceae bacterium OttesenSCG-928-F15]